MNFKKLLLSGKIGLEEFNLLDISKFSDSEKDLIFLLQKLKNKELQINAENVFLQGNRELLIIYITMSNEVDKNMVKKENRRK